MILSKLSRKKKEVRRFVYTIGLKSLLGDSAWAGVVNAAHGRSLVPLVGRLYVSSCAG